MLLPLPTTCVFKTRFSSHAPTKTTDHSRRKAEADVSSQRASVHTDVGDLENGKMIPTFSLIGGTHWKTFLQEKKMLFMLTCNGYHYF